MAPIALHHVPVIKNKKENRQGSKSGKEKYGSHIQKA